MSVQGNPRLGRQPNMNVEEQSSRPPPAHSLPANVMLPSISPMAPRMQIDATPMNLLQYLNSLPPQQFNNLMLLHAACGNTNALNLQRISSISPMIAMQAQNLENSPTMAGMAGLQGIGLKEALMMRQALAENGRMAAQHVIQHNSVFNEQILIQQQLAERRNLLQQLLLQQQAAAAVSSASSVTGKMMPGQSSMNQTHAVHLNRQLAMRKANMQKNSSPSSSSPHTAAAAALLQSRKRPSSDVVPAQVHLHVNGEKRLKTSGHARPPMPANKKQ
eukprot:629992-Hanusia_phi.AAC.2